MHMGEELKIPLSSLDWLQKQIISDLRSTEGALFAYIKRRRIELTSDDPRVNFMLGDITRTKEVLAALTALVITEVADQRGELSPEAITGETDSI